MSLYLLPNREKFNLRILNLTVEEPSRNSGIKDFLGLFQIPTMKMISGKVTASLTDAFFFLFEYSLTV